MAIKSDAALFLRSGFNYDSDTVSLNTGLACKDASLAQQNQKEEADINTIVRRFGLTGELPSAKAMPQYGDFTHVTDYQSALNAVKEAEDAFAALGSKVRKRFHNSPAEFMDFMADPANLEEAITLGLAVKKVAPAAAVKADDGATGTKKVEAKADSAGAKE